MKGRLKMVLNIVLGLVFLAVAVPAVLLSYWGLRPRKQKPETFRTGSTEYLDLNAWERAKANMALNELERWHKMNAAESRRIERVCDSCGAHVCKCAFNGNALGRRDRVV